MSDLSRRTVLAGGALTVFFSSFCTCAVHAEDDIRGCQISDAVYDRIAPWSSETRKYIHGDEPIIARSGDANLDYALAQTLAKLAGVFEVLPGFGYYDDFTSGNAYATARTRLDRADGTVLFGLDLLRKLRTLPMHPDAAIATVCAHEFGHILQFKRDLFRVVDAGQRNVKRSELQADYFSGYFAGLRRIERPSFPSEVFITTMRSLGDDNFSSKTHHGTPRERARAVERGFNAAFLERRSLSDAISDSTAYAMLI